MKASGQKSYSIFFACAWPSNVKSQDSMKSWLVRTPKALRDFLPPPPNFRGKETKLKEVK